MVMWRRLFVGLVLLGAGNAFALLQPAEGIEYRVPSPWAPQTWFSSQAAACTAAAPGGGRSELANEGTFCYIYYSDGNYATGLGVNPRSAPAACPANSTAVTGGCQCSTGFDESGGACVPNQCASKKGTPTTVRTTICYTRTPDDSDTKCIGGSFNPWAGGSVCSDGCAMDFSSVSNAWISQAPTPEGLYRNSVDATYIPTGAACTASGTNPADQAIKADAPRPPCPGYTGEVNGKPGCYGTAEKPVVGEAKPSSFPNSSAKAGNPPAGKPAASGEGSTGSPTPSAGQGGPEGGPAGAAVGGKGGNAGGTATGTGKVGGGGGGSGENEQQNCGAPGQPQCKIDETGTPSSGASEFASATAAAEAAKDAAKAGIDGAANLQAPAWSFSFQLPSGCAGYQVANFKGTNFTMNPCQYQSTIHDLMAMLWAAVTAFCIIGMVGRTIREA